jgi:hypothetical protein
MTTRDEARTEDVKIMELPTQQEEEESPTHSKITIALTCATATTVSVTMVLLNKAIILNIPFGGGLVLIQNAATILLIQTYRLGSGPDGISWRSIWNNIPCAVLFGLSTFTSIQSLAYLSVTAFTIFRNTQSILAFPMDYMLRGERLKPVSVYLLFTILLGTCAYCGRDIRANTNGIIWAAANLVSTTLYTILTKIRLNTDAKTSTLAHTLDLAWYNNVLSLPIVGAAAAMQAIYTISSTPLIRPGCGVYCWIMVAISCFSGCAMSVVSLKTQTLMTPTSFLTFNNLNKIPAMLISAAIWPELETADTTQEIMGVVLSIFGGYLFAVSKKGDVNPFALLASGAMSIALIPLIVLSEMAEEQRHLVMKALLNSTNTTQP